MAKETPNRPWLTRYAGKTFYFAFRTDMKRYRQLVTSHGGAVVTAVTPNLDYLIWDRWHTRSNKPKELAAKLNREGATIRILNTDQFSVLFRPSRRHALAMLRGTAEDIEHWLNLAYHCNLTRADLRGIRFGQSRSFRPFLGGQMDGGDLRGAEINHGDLVCGLNKVHLEGASLIAASFGPLTDCNLSKTDLTRAHVNTRIVRCTFSEAKMHRFDGYCSCFASVETGACLRGS